MNIKVDKKPPGGWILTLQVVIAVLITLVLSFWQLTKGFEKSGQRSDFVARLQEPPIELSDYQAQESAYRQLKLLGSYIPERSFIVSYQRHNQRPGYWIVTPFTTEIGTFLVNRGWIPIQQHFRETPVFDTPEGTLEITGVVWPHRHFPSDRSYDEPTWPKKVYRLNIERMAEITRSFDDEIRLLSGSPGVFTPLKFTVENEPARHWGYAFQWLVIGGLVVSGYWFFAVRKGEIGST